MSGVADRHRAMNGSARPLLALVLAALTGVAAFNATVTTSAAAVEPPQDAAVQERKHLRTLDELLGLADAVGGAVDNAELEESLRDGEPLDRLRTVERLLGDASDAIAAGDLSLGTQRLQERASKMIDDLLADAEQQQQQQQGGSSSSGGGEASPSDGQQGADPAAGDKSADRDGSGQADAQERAEQTPKDGEGGRDGNRDGDTPPQRQDGDPTGALEATAIEWGSLPPRVRDVLRQGLRERMSTPYRAWTEAYFRRIAEESRR